MKKLTFLLCTISALFLSSPSFALAIYCERTTSDFSAFSSEASYEGWFPKERFIHSREFVDVGTESKSMVWEETITASDGSIFKRNSQLVPNGNLIVHLTGESNFKRVAPQRYTCDSTPADIRTAQAADTSKPETNSEAATKTDDTPVAFPLFASDTFNFLTRFSYEENKFNNIFISDEAIFASSDSSYMKSMINNVVAGSPLTFAFGVYKNNCGDIYEKVDYIDTVTKVITLSDINVDGLLLSDFDLSKSRIYTEPDGETLAIYLQERDGTSWTCAGGFTLQSPNRINSYEILQKMHASAS